MTKPPNELNGTFILAGLAFIILALLLAVFTKKKPVELANAKKRELGLFSVEEVAMHNTRDDLWLILRLRGQPRVYDVTSYVDEHPGGDAIMTNAGGDSTEAFTGPQHPPRVMDLIDDFCIGTLKE
jgi:cytochrome b involved in lipid metabolism